MGRLQTGIAVFVISCLSTLRAAPVDFAEEVRPLLNKHCVACHGGVKTASGISFISRSQALAEGKSGLRPIIPNRPGESELLKRIASEDPEERMPPAEHGPALAPAERELLTRWIAEGAPWKKHWAFEKPSRPQVPGVKEPNWPRNEIDHFVLAPIEAAGRAPMPPATPAELIRRASLDLIGLPPSPEAVAIFELDPSEEAYAALVDDLLASQHFGERWAAVWMDVARYADSEGLGLDSRREIWKYRDWLIDAFNADKPFDVFVKEQLAGDLMESPTTEQRIATAFHRLTQSNNEGGTDDEEFRTLAVMDRVSTTWEALQGVTFGCVQCHSHPYDPLLHQEYYEFMAFFNNTQDADLGEGFPKLKVPLDRKHYLTAAAHEERAKALRDSLLGEVEKRRSAADWQPVTFARAASSTNAGVEIVPVKDHTEFHATGNMAKGTIFTLDLEAPKSLDKLTALRIDLLPKDPEKARHSPDWGAVLSGITLEWRPPGDESFQKVKLVEVLSDEPDPFYDPNDSLTKGSRGVGPYSKQFHERQAVVLLEKPLALPRDATLRLNLRHDLFALGAFPLVTKRGRVWLTDDPAWERFARSESVVSARKELKEIREALKEIPMTAVPVMAERPAHLKRETRRFERGNWLEKGDLVTAGTPRSFPPFAEDVPRNRLTLAEWFVSPDNPLTARVLVNRLWEQLFGKGLVETLEDFGSAGAKPSHPELLDHLAVRFQKDHGWSVKDTLREIVLSATYRQSARASQAHYEEDPGNRLLSRGPRQRLTAEMVRDHALAAAGLLTRKMHGPPVHPPIPAGVWKPFDGGDKWKTAKPNEDARYRRAVYTYWKRSIPYPMFATFDAPSRELCLQRRLPSNTPLQALTLLNDAVFDECAQHLARRMKALSEQLESQLHYGYLLTTSQRPDDAVMAELKRLHARLVQETKATQEEALASIASVLLNLDAALTK